MDLRTYARVLLRGWLVLVGCLLAGMLSAGAVLLVQSVQYAATAQVVFTAQHAGDGQDLAYAGNYVQGRMQTFKNLAVSPAVLDAVVDDLKDADGADSLAQRTSVEVSQIDTILRVTVLDADAERASTRANAVAAQLIAAVDSLENGSAAADSLRINGTVIGPAEPADSPAVPDVPFTLVAGLLAGLFAGVSIVSVRHFFTAGSMS